MSKPVIDNCGRKSCVRALRTAFVEEWLGREERGQEECADEPIIGQTRIAGREMPIRRFGGIPPNRDASGEIEQMGLLAGQGVGLVAEILPAADLVRKIADEARIVIAQRLGQPQV